MDATLLGLEIELSFSEHISSACKKVSQRISLLKKLLSGQLRIMQMSSGLTVIRKVLGGPLNSKNVQLE